MQVGAVYIQTVANILNSHHLTLSSTLVAIRLDGMQYIIITQDMSGVIDAYINYTFRSTVVLQLLLYCPCSPRSSVIVVTETNGVLRLLGERRL